LLLRFYYDPLKQPRNRMGADSINRDPRHEQLNPLKTFLAYHDRTKHHPHRYAPGPRGLDWDNQPDPFRRFEGAPLVPLTIAAQDDPPPYESLHKTGTVLPAEVTHRSLSRFFECSLVLSAWKVFSPWFYRRLFWEAGLVGQVLYLEAEAAGLRGTGIGAYFDDAVHDAVGLSGRRFQSLYHFTVGGPLEDPRLATEAPYPAPRE